jgi:hypothetical protein
MKYEICIGTSQEKNDISEIINNEDFVIKKSWFLVQYKGVAIGFAKNLGNRINNYYPKEWRILKDF